MIQVQKDSSSYRCSIGDDQFTVYFGFPRLIVLSGDLGQQMFENEGDCPPNRLHKYLKDKDSVYRYALLHKEGVTNKRKFMACVHKLVDERKFGLTEVDRKELYKFIHTVNLDPEPVRNQLLLAGYERIIGSLDFEDKKPELISTCDAMCQLVEYLKKTP